MNPEYGTFLASVSQTEDLTTKRAKFYIPQIFGKVESNWAEPITKNGQYPIVGDLLYVAFNSGDINKPIYFPGQVVYNEPSYDYRYFQLSRASSFSVNSATYVKAQFTVVDSASPANPFTTPADFVMPAGWGGYWNFKWIWNWAANATGGRIVNIRFNGDGTITGGTQFLQHATPAASINGIGNWEEATMLDTFVDDGDKLEFFCYQNSGGAINFNSYTLYGSKRPI